MSSGIQDATSERISLIGRYVGLVAFVIALLLPTPDGWTGVQHRLLAITLLMAVYWFTQALPIAVTSLIPLVAFPLLGIQPSKIVSKSYIDPNIFLFMGGFMIALGIERWGLHRRMALHMVRRIGTSLPRVILGFMLATGFLSMWISNTASTLLMLPIGLALLTSLADLAERDGSEAGSPLSSAAKDSISRFSIVMMLAIAYSASIGGFTTLVGTPTNLTFQGIWQDSFSKAPEISAGEWMLATIPLGAVMMLCAWGVLVWRLKPIPGVEKLDRRFFSDRLAELGKPTRSEKLMLAIFVSTAALWIFRRPLVFGGHVLLPGWETWPKQLLLQHGVEPDVVKGWFHDSIVAIGMAALAFFLPGERGPDGRRRQLLDWETAQRLPWGILLLIGGGFALANAFQSTDLARQLGDLFAELVSGWPTWLLVVAVCLLMTFLTEITSNVATVSAVLPVLAGLAVSDKIQIDPRLIMIPATISASCAFMLPIATPPNAIVFGSGKVTMGQMARKGLLLNLIGVVLISLATYFFFVPRFGISLDSRPTWAEQHQSEEPGNTTTSKTKNQD